MNSSGFCPVESLLCQLYPPWHIIVQLDAASFFTERCCRIFCGASANPLFSKKINFVVHHTLTVIQVHHKHWPNICACPSTQPRFFPYYFFTLRDILLAMHFNGKHMTCSIAKLEPEHHPVTNTIPHYSVFNSGRREYE